ncbi:hypothetical protein ACRJ4B_12220 [Streptomyces sp. GTA36]
MAAVSRAGTSLTLEQLRAEAVGARATIVETAAAPKGRGLKFTLAVLLLNLGVAATGAYLLSGFGLHTFDRRPQIGDGLTTAGVTTAATVAGASAGNIARLLKAARRRCSDSGTAERGPESGQAADDWGRALLERGVMPFLLGRLDREAPGLQGRTTPS